jgi:heme ABC exporter ATP-binding subunit CcmA
MDSANRDCFSSLRTSDKRLQMPAPVIEARRLSRRFAEVDAVAAIDLVVDSGDAVAVLGANGAGKTTLLRLIATLLRPSTGSLNLFGQGLADGGVRARQRIGFLSHNSFLYPDLSPNENLSFYARMFGVFEAERIREVLQLVGLTGWRNRPVRTLSRGLEQRCSLARALLHRPDLLLLDEPFNGLDVDSAAMLMDVLHSEQRRGATVLLTTHDLTKALEICRRGVVLARGRLQWDGALTGVTVEQLRYTYTAVSER